MLVIFGKIRYIKNIVYLEKGSFNMKKKFKIIFIVLSTLLIFSVSVCCGIYKYNQKKVRKKQKIEFLANLEKKKREGLVRMGERKIITNDNEFLHKKSKTVDMFDEKLSVLIDDMIETLHKKEDAVGLAAVQIGILKRVIVIDVGQGVLEIVNPSIVEEKGEQIEYEGCLSYPEVYKKVKRPAYVKVKAYDRNGKEYTIEGEGLLARALCHEIDHLNGIVFLDRAIAD